MSPNKLPDTAGLERCILEIAVTSTGCRSPSWMTYENTPLPCLRRIRRRRRRARARVLPRLRLWASHALLKLLHTCSEIKDELHTHLAPRVIDRLRLRALHARKIRCTKVESSPPAP